MTATNWRGIFPSLPTPFTPEGELDLEAQRAIVRFALDSGAHGLICFGLAGEVFRLSVAERLQLLEVILEENAGLAPVLVGVSTEDELSSVNLAKAVVEAGVDGIVVPPPLTIPDSRTELLKFFERVSGSVEVPVMLQDAPEYLQVEVGPEVVETLAERIPNLAVVKLEIGADGLAEWTESFGDRLTIFCGSGGLYLIDCLEHGAAGVAPGTDLTDLLVQVYERWSTQDSDGAWDLLTNLLPMLGFQMQTIDHYNATAKQVLLKRGVIPFPGLRPPAVQLGETGKALVDSHLARLGLTAAAGA